MGIALRLFGINTAPLGCAVAIPAPAELCTPHARQLHVRRMRTFIELQERIAEIKRLEEAAKAIENEMNDRVRQRQQENRNI
jgi:hypothetical protein